MNSLIHLDVSCVFARTLSRSISGALRGLSMFIYVKWSRATQAVTCRTVSAPLHLKADIQSSPPLRKVSAPVLSLGKGKVLMIFKIDRVL